MTSCCREHPTLPALPLPMNPAAVSYVAQVVPDVSQSGCSQYCFVAFTLRTLPFRNVSRSTDTGEILVLAGFQSGARAISHTASLWRSKRGHLCKSDGVSMTPSAWTFIQMAMKIMRWHL